MTTEENATSKLKRSILEDIRSGDMPPGLVGLIERMRRKGRTDEEAAGIVAAILVGATAGGHIPSPERLEELFLSVPDELLE